MKAKISKNKNINCSVCSPSSIVSNLNEQTQMSGNIDTPQPIDAGSTERGPQGEKGDTGNGIEEIVKTSTEGLVDTYTIYYTDGQTSDFEVTNGKNAETFVFEQALSANTWVIQHNLDKYPSVYAVDSLGRVAIPNEIEYNNENQMTLYFLFEFSGKAFLN